MLDSDRRRPKEVEDLSYDDIAEVIEKIKDSGIDPMLQHERTEEEEEL